MYYQYLCNINRYFMFISAVMQSCSLVDFFNCSEYFNDDPEICALPQNWIESTTGELICRFNII